MTPHCLYKTNIKWLAVLCLLCSNGAWKRRSACSCLCAFICSNTDKNTSSMVCLTFFLSVTTVNVCYTSLPHWTEFFRLKRDNGWLKTMYAMFKGLVTHRKNRKCRYLYIYFGHISSKKNNKNWLDPSTPHYKIMNQCQNRLQKWPKGCR